MGVSTAEGKRKTRPGGTDHRQEGNTAPANTRKGQSAMATWKYEFLNPVTRSLHFAEGGFLSYEKAMAWAKHTLAIDRRWADDENVQDRMRSAARQCPELEFDLRIIPGEKGEPPISLRVTMEH